MEDNTQSNGSQTILIWNKREFKPKMITRDRDGHRVMIKGTPIKTTQELSIHIKPSTGVYQHIQTIILKFFF